MQIVEYFLFDQGRLCFRLGSHDLSVPAIGDRFCPETLMPLEWVQLITGFWDDGSDALPDRVSALRSRSRAACDGCTDRLDQEASSVLRSGLGTGDCGTP